MKNTFLKDSLLDDLWHETGCMYLSDLKSPEEQELLCAALYRLCPEEYSIRAWSEAAAYLTGSTQALGFHSQRQAREWLAAFCGGGEDCSQ